MAIAAVINKIALLQKGALLTFHLRYNFYFYT